MDFANEIIEFEKFLEQENCSINTKAQYITFYKKINNFLSEQQKDLSISVMQEYIDSLNMPLSKIWALSAIKKMLMFKKSSLIFEINKLKVVE